MKKIAVLGITILLILVVGLSGCQEQNQQGNNEITIQGLLIAATNDSGFCYFAFTANFTFERFIGIFYNESGSEFAYYLNNTYIITRNGEPLIDNTTEDVYDARIDGIFKMGDEVIITGVIGTTEEPGLSDEIMKSIDIISIDIVTTREDGEYL